MKSVAEYLTDTKEWLGIQEHWTQGAYCIIEREWGPRELSLDAMQREAEVLKDTGNCMTCLAGGFYLSLVMDGEGGMLTQDTGGTLVEQRALYCLTAAISPDLDHLEMGEDPTEAVFSIIFGFNDASGRKYEDIAPVIDRAIEIATARGW